MLPGRGTAAELAFNKRYRQQADAVHAVQGIARELQLEGLSLGYATAVAAAYQVLRCIGPIRGLNTEEVHKVQAFVLRVVDSIQPAARSLVDFTLPEELALASRLQKFAC